MRFGGNGKDDLGDCIDPPVRSLRTTPRLQVLLVSATGVVELAHTERFDLQAARFEPYQMSPQITLAASKTSKEASVSASLAVVAYDVLGPGGIGDAWLEGGLNASMDMQCTNAAPSSCEGSTCSTVWLQPTSDDFSVFSTAHIRVAVAKLSPTLAMLNVTGATRGLGEGGYGFRLHVPAFNGSMWRWVSILGTFDVRAVADAGLSEVRLRNPTAPASVSFDGRVNHLDSLRVNILARDADGHAIDRTGEQLAVTVVPLSSYGDPNTTEIAQHDGATGQYFVLFRITAPGDHAVFVKEAHTGLSARRATFRIVCAMGFVETDRQCLEEASKVQIIVGGTIGAVFLAVAVLAMVLLYRNREHARRFALSFLKREFFLVSKSMAELWDILGDRMPRVTACRLRRTLVRPGEDRVPSLAHDLVRSAPFAVYTYTTVLNSGNDDLLIAFTVFLPFALVVSALSIGMNMRLLGKLVRVRLAQHAGHRQPLRQGSSQQLSSSLHDGPSETHRARKQMLWQQLAQRIVVQRAQLAHQERTSANDIELKHFGMSMLLLLTEVSSQRAGRRSAPRRSVALHHSFGRIVCSGCTGPPAFRHHHRPLGAHSTPKGRRRGAGAEQVLLDGVQHGGVRVCSPQHDENGRHASDKGDQSEALPAAVDEKAGIAGRRTNVGAARGGARGARDGCTV